MRSLFPWVSLGCFCRKTTACAMPLSFRSRALRVGSCVGGGGHRHSEDPGWGDEGPASPGSYSPPSGPSAAPSWSAVLGGTCQVEGWSTLWSLSSGHTPWTSPPSLVWGEEEEHQFSIILSSRCYSGKIRSCRLKTRTSYFFRCSMSCGSRRTLVSAGLLWLFSTRSSCQEERSKVMEGGWPVGGENVRREWTRTNLGSRLHHVDHVVDQLGCSGVDIAAAAAAAEESRT